MKFLPEQKMKKEWIKCLMEPKKKNTNFTAYQNKHASDNNLLVPEICKSS